MLRRYEPSDFTEVQEWAKQWDQSYDERWLSPVGFIVPGLAAYFIYETPTKVCFLENLISNKEADKQLVDEAINEVTTACMIQAKEMGYEMARSCTNNPQVILRAIKAGARATSNYALLTKQL